MIARLVRSVDFERVLRTRSCASSAHFALHHLPDRPSTPKRSAPRFAQEALRGELSTGEPRVEATAVDDRVMEAPGAVWLGAVVPKRHARRSVTRTLLKRQIRAVVGVHQQSLARGLWVVRLRATFDRATFVSAASGPLKSVARGELEQLIGRAAQPRAAR